MESYPERRPLGAGWLLAALGAVVVVGCFGYFVRAEARRAAIQKALAEDKALHDRVAAEATLLDVACDQSGITGRYVQGLRAIDLSGCPDDFRTAFRAHVEAWAGYETVARRHGGFRGFFRGFFAGGAAVVVDGLSEAADAQAEIRRTWDEVARVARGRGATVP